MRNPTCYVRFDADGKTVVWTLCPACAADIVIHPQPDAAGGVSLPWYAIACPQCGRKPSDLGYGADSGQ
ncbi:MAG TPA: hypothetical protein VFV54_05385 [Thermoanaerobaculia bacterium]|nr:hypothetical protein [Thermoanaerobaculia bacterium]